MKKEMKKNEGMQTSGFGRVAVLVGGCSSEREISLLGGSAVCQALLNKGIDAQLIDIQNGIGRVAEFDRAFIMVHGKGGEDGQLQGYLQTLNIPYTGSGILASSVCMNKYITKLLWTSQGVPTPEYQLLPSGLFNEANECLEFPVVVKPCSEGSSIGMSVVDEKEGFENACLEARKYGDNVLVERWVEGDELTVSIIGNTVCPVLKIETSHSFYDYKAKYESNKTHYVFPEYEAEEIERIKARALSAFDVLGATGWGRVDMIRDKEGGLWFLEVNTVPGMTDHSLVPKAAKKMGIGYDELSVMILKTVHS